MSLLHARNLDQLRLIISQLGKNRRVFILFFGSLNSDGQSWCPDCRESQEIVDNGVKLFLPKHGSFIRCSVGDRTEWKDLNNPFRKDSDFQITNIPTLIEWRTSKRLVEKQLLDGNLLKTFFEPK